MALKELIAVARGDAPADLIISNARIVNTFTGEIEEGAVAVAGGRIAGIGDYRDARRVVDLAGRYLAPGLIDGHVHLESAMLHVNEYARAVVPHGTLAAVTDPHEIANVAGLEGMRYLMDCARRVPMDLFFTAPSCVPTTNMETAGARVGPEELRRAMRWRNVVALGEMMDFARVINGEDEVLEKLRTAGSLVRDGHAPEVRGKELNAYLCPLIGSDHESTGYEEAQEKLRRGLHLMIREGSAEKNLEALLPLVNDRNYHRCMLVVDDRDPLDIWRDGDLDAVVRKAIRLGLDPIRALQMTTLNPASYFRLEGHGGIAPGYYANLLVLSDLREFHIDEVHYRGRLVARDGSPTFQVSVPQSHSINHSVQIKAFSQDKLVLRDGNPGEHPAIEIIPGQILTRHVLVRPRRVQGVIHSDPDQDIIKLAVIERHQATGRIGLGLVKGFGITRGAIGSSLAHDSHNVIIAGASDEDMYAVAREIEANQGGLACALNGRVLASLPLPIAGLLSPEPLETVVQKMDALESAARELGCSVKSPFSILSFLALPVIPELRLTDMGLVDVAKGELLGNS